MEGAAGVPGLDKPCPGHSPGSMTGGKVPLSLSQITAIAFLWERPMAPATLGRVGQEGPGYGIVRCEAWLAPKCYLQAVSWTPCIRIPLSTFTLRPLLLLFLSHPPSLHRASAIFPSNTIESLLALRPCPGHLPQEALLIKLLIAASLPHLALERLQGTLAPTWRPTGPSQALCPIGQCRGGDKNIAT